MLSNEDGPTAVVRKRMQTSLQVLCAPFRQFKGHKYPVAMSSNAHQICSSSPSKEFRSCEWFIVAQCIYIYVIYTSFYSTFKKDHIMRGH